MFSNPFVDLTYIILVGRLLKNASAYHQQRRIIMKLRRHRLPNCKFQFHQVSLPDLYLICLFSITMKKWTINRAIHKTYTDHCYFLDPGMQSESTCCLNAISTSHYALLRGSQASRKTTQLFWLWERLIVMGYQAL